MGIIHPLYYVMIRFYLNEQYTTLKAKRDFFFDFYARKVSKLRQLVIS